MNRTARQGRAGLIAAAIVLAAAAIVVFVLLSERGGTPGAGPGADPAADQLARELAAAYFADDDRGKAAAAIAPLVERPRPDAEDLASAAAIELRTANVEGAQSYLERALELAPDSPRVRYNLARLERWNGNYAGALPHLEKVRALHPDDVPTLLMLADTYENLERRPEAQAIYAEVLGRGVDKNGSWHLTALYRMSLIERDAGHDEQSAAYQGEWEELQGRGLKAPDGTQLDIGQLGAIPTPPPRGSAPSGTGKLPEIASAAVRFPSLAGATGALVADMDNNGLLDVVGYGPAGIDGALLYAAPEGWEESRLAEHACEGALAYDFGNDDDLDLLVWNAAELALLVADGADTRSGFGWSVGPRAFEPFPAPVRHAVAVDYDHEGDLDLLVLGDFGARLLRDDGAAGTDGRFTDVTAEAGLAAIARAGWAVIEDFDTDQDVDLLIGPELFLASNLRGGRFEDASARLGGAGPWPVAPVAADLGGDGRPDLIATLAGAVELWSNSPSGRFERSGAPRVVPGAEHAPWAHDLDLDGALDVVWQADGALVGLLAVGLDVEQPFELALPGRLAAIADVEGDRAWDLVALQEDGALLQATQPLNNGVRLGYRGSKDNRRGVGAVVEVRSGPLYRRLFWKGEAELVGVGERTETDLVRVTWPNGVVQYDDRRELGDRAATGDTLGFLQSEGLIGSCPFLYTWNGSDLRVRHRRARDHAARPADGAGHARAARPRRVRAGARRAAARQGRRSRAAVHRGAARGHLPRPRCGSTSSTTRRGARSTRTSASPSRPSPSRTCTRSRRRSRRSRATGTDGRDWTAELAAIDGALGDAASSRSGRSSRASRTPHCLELAFDPARRAPARASCAS